MNKIVLRNQFYTYTMEVADDGHLKHCGFLPADVQPRDSSRELKRVYPYEVALAFAESQCLGWRFADAMLCNDASHDLVVDRWKCDDTCTTVFLRHPRLSVEVQLCYVCTPDSPVLKRFTRVINTGDTALELQHVSSFVLSGFPYFGRSEDLHLYRYVSGWGCEGDQHRDSFSDLGLLAPGCRSAWSFNNNSAFSSNKLFPYFVVEEQSSDLFWGVQNESGNQWRVELGGGDVGNPDWFYMQGGLLNFAGSQWSKQLKPGEVFETPRVALTVATGNIDNIHNQFHAYQRNELIRQPENDRHLPTIFNDWQAMHGDTSQSRIHDQLQSLQELGIEIYVTDAGWYTDPGQNWSNYVGCWNSSAQRFPNGLSAVSQDIAAHGMIPGIWCEIEMAGPHSPHYNDPDMVLQCHGHFITQGPRRFLDFRKEAVRSYASGVIRSLYESGFRYLKIDYNADCAPGCDGEEPGIVENLRQARIAYASWLESVLTQYKDLIVEHCSSGGMKLDYDNLTRGSLASITDQWDYRHTGSILSNVSRLVHPVQCENWSTLKPDMDQATMEFTLSNSMMGRMCVSGVLSQFSDEQKATVKKAIDFYKRYRFIIQNPSVFYHAPARNILDRDNLKIMEYKTGEMSMVYISSHNAGGTFAFSPKLEQFEVIDQYPCASGFSVQNNTIQIEVPKDQLFARILILKKA